MCNIQHLSRCSAFYVQKNIELERGALRLVINYKPLNEALKWIIYPILNKKIFTFQII
jgi:hypothetical protein